jgi:hypothetical protein
VKFFDLVPLNTHKKAAVKRDNERIAPTSTSPESQTVCGSSFASKLIVLIKSVGPPPIRSLISGGTLLNFRVALRDFA